MEEVKESEPHKVANVSRPEDLLKIEELADTVSSNKETISEQNIRIEEL